MPVQHPTQDPIPSFPTSRLQQVLPAAAIVLILALLTLIVTYPLITQLDSSLGQNPHWSRDALHHTYVLWWFKQALVNHQSNPAALGEIYYPTGAYYPLLLTYSTVYAPGLVLLLFLSPVAAYNVVFLLTFFLSGLTGYALCSYLTRNRWAGLLGGIVYAFFPGRVAHALAGHLELATTYLFPLYLLLLIKTVRRPRWQTALLCGLVLAPALLVQPLFIPFLLAPITVVWLAYEAWVLRTPIGRRTWGALAIAFAVAALIALPLFLPVLLQQADSDGNYLEALGTVSFSADLLGIVAPSPTHPVLQRLGIVPEYALRAAPPNWRIAELLTYAGVVPLGLSLLAAIKQWRRLGAWTLVAISAAILSLGPILKLGGEPVTFVTDGIESTVALPYALVANLPLLSLNRAPARLNTTLMLALAVLSAHGLAWLMPHLRRRWPVVVAVALCAFTLVELLVIWPCPTTPIEAPAYLDNLAQGDNPGAVLNLPVTSGRVKEIGLFFQTIHRRPVFDCWFQRTLPVFPNTAEFLDGLLNPETTRDIVPEPPPGARAVVARAEGTGHVFLYTPYVGNVETKMHLLETEFGPPQAVEASIAMYEVPPGPEVPDDLVYALPNNPYSSLEQGWQCAEDWHGEPARWMGTSADLYIYSPRQQEGALQFRALPYANPRRLEIEVNQAALPPLVIGEWLTYTTTGFTLQPGLNQISLHTLDGCIEFEGDPRCSGVALSAAGDASECSRYIASNRCLGLLFQHIRFVPVSHPPAQVPVDAFLGGQVHLLGYDLVGDPTPGQSLTLTLYWEALRAPTDDYTVFVHLLGPDGDLLAQYDGPPLRGLHPTSRWTPGDIFTQQALLPIPADAPPGEYALLTGMYTYPDLTRLPVAGDRPYAQDGLVWLENVSIQP